MTVPSSLLPARESHAEPTPPARRAMLDAQKRSFLRMVSHELRTPLNSIIGFAEIISKELAGPLGSPQYSEYAEHIRLSGMKLLKLVNQVLEIARLEGRATDLDRVAEPLDHAVDDVLESLRDEIAARRIRVTVADEVRDATGDDARLPGARAGQDQEWPVDVNDGFALLGI